MRLCGGWQPRRASSKAERRPEGTGAACGNAPCGEVDPPVLLQARTEFKFKLASTPSRRGSPGPSSDPAPPRDGYAMRRLSALPSSLLAEEEAAGHRALHCWTAFRARYPPPRSSAYPTPRPWSSERLSMPPGQPAFPKWSLIPWYAFDPSSPMPSTVPATPDATTVAAIKGE